MEFHSIRFGAPAVGQPFGGLNHDPGHRRIGIKLGKPYAFYTPAGGQVPQNLGGTIHRDARQLNNHLKLAGLPGPGRFELVGAAGGEHNRPIFGNGNRREPAGGHGFSGQQCCCKQKEGYLFHISPR